MTTPAGVCRFCGCSHFSPCPYGCGWANRAQTVCTACAPAAKAEGITLRTLARAGYRSDRPGIKAPLAFVAAFHRGFIVGWFGISKRSPYARNPYWHPPKAKQVDQAEAWDLGHRRGAEASRAYQRVCGPLVNGPRKHVLQRSAAR